MPVLFMLPWHIQLAADLVLESWFWQSAATWQLPPPAQEGMRQSLVQRLLEQALSSDNDQKLPRSPHPLAPHFAICFLHSMNANVYYNT